jgi:hypothetical protein
MLAFMFQVAHVVDDVVFPTPEECGGTLKVKGGWAATQVPLTAYWDLHYVLL